MDEVLTRLNSNDGQATFHLNNLGKDVYVYSQDTAFAVYFTNGNIWETTETPLIFEFKNFGLRRLTEYLLENGWEI
jgi:hypothetical protein